MNTRFPRGKLNEDDEGSTAMAIGVEHGCVKIIFPEPMLWLALHPDEVEALAAALLEKAKLARKGMV